MDEYFDVEKLRAQIQLWMPDKDGDPYHNGERLAYNSVLQFIEASAKPKEACPSKDYLRLKEKIKQKVFESYGPDDPELTMEEAIQGAFAHFFYEVERAEAEPCLGDALNEEPKPHDNTPSLQDDFPLLGSQEASPLLKPQEDFPPSDSDDDLPSFSPIETERIKEYYLIKENLKKNIVSCGISVRVFNIFKAKNIQTFADLVQYRRGEIFTFRNFGMVSLKQVERLLEKQGLHFGMNPRLYGVTPKKKEL